MSTTRRAGFLALGMLLSEARAVPPGEAPPPSTAAAWNDAGIRALDEGRDEDAVRAFREALAATGDPALRRATRRMHFNLGMALYEAARLDEAAQVLQALYDRQEHTLIPDRAMPVAQQLGRVELALGHPQAAVALLEEGLARARPRDGRHAMTLHQDLSASHRAMGSLVLARAHAEQGVALAEALFGSGSADHLEASNDLALVLGDLGEDAAAADLLQECLDQPAATGLLRATLLDHLAIAWMELGDPRRALPASEEALRVRTELLAPGNPTLAVSWNNLARARAEAGQLQAARDASEQAWEIWFNLHGRDHPLTLQALTNLSVSLSALGDTTAALVRAEDAARRAPAVFGPDHPQTGWILHNLAEVERRYGELADARQHMEGAVRIRRAALGPLHPDTLKSRNSMAVLLWRAGAPAEAAETLDALIVDHQQLPVPRPLDLAVALVNRATLAVELGDAARARPLLEQALTLNLNGLGPDHPGVAAILTDLAVEDLVDGRISEGRTHVSEAIRILALQRRRELPRLTMRQARQFLADTHHETSIALDLALAEPGAPGAAELAMSALLAFKGQALAHEQERLRAVRRSGDPQIRRRWEEMTALRARLDAGYQDGGLSRQDRMKLEAQARVHEEAIARAVSLPEPPAPPSPEQVLAALPEDTALIELQGYFPYLREERRLGPRRYLAVVARGDGHLAIQDLGPADELDALAVSLRTALEGGGATQAPARELGRRLLEPLLADLGEARHLVVSPDWLLHQVPWAAMRHPDGSWLIEHHTLRVIDSSRELVEAPDPTPNGPPVLVFDVDFGPGGRWPDLPGSRMEGEALQDLLPGATVLTGAQATAPALQAVRSPSILHLATHGFFRTEGLRPAPEQPAEAPELASRDAVPLGLAPATDSAADTVPWENHLMRAGIALAGANGEGAAGDNGVLSALEMGLLDLSGTELVVLSACESSRGLHTIGQGVQGMRASLAAAGSASQVLSLWKVPDRATGVLMTRFYEGLVAGLPREEALALAQRCLLEGGEGCRIAGEDARHPRAWAAFLLSGAGGPLSRSP